MQPLKKHLPSKSAWESTFQRGINYSSHSAPNVIKETQTHYSMQLPTASKSLLLHKGSGDTLTHHEQNTC